MLERNIAVACPECNQPARFHDLPPDFPCPNCGKQIPVYPTALALMHLFSAVAFPKSQYAYELLRFLCEHPWGDALRIGRHDWLLAGCSTSAQEFADTILNGDGIAVAAVSRLWGQGGVPEYFLEANILLGQAAIKRLQSDETDQNMRERLYYLVKTWPSAEGVYVLSELQKQHPSDDGTPSTIVGSRAAEAFIECQVCGLPKDQQHEERAKLHNELLRDLFFNGNEDNSE